MKIPVKAVRHIGRFEQSYYVNYGLYVEYLKVASFSLCVQGNPFAWS